MCILKIYIYTYKYIYIFIYVYVVYVGMGEKLIYSVILSSYWSPIINNFLLYIILKYSNKMSASCFDFAEKSTLTSSFSDHVWHLFTVQVDTCWGQERG